MALVIVRPSGCPHASIASTISGDSSVMRSTRLTWDGVQQDVQDGIEKVPATLVRMLNGKVRQAVGEGFALRTKKVLNVHSLRTAHHR